MPRSSGSTSRVGNPGGRSTSSRLKGLKVPDRDGVRVLDEGNNGLVPIIAGDRISLELVHQGELKRSRTVHVTCNEAEQNFVLALTKLMCAGITAGITPSLVERISERVLDIVDVFDVPWNDDDKVPLCFNSKSVPVYDFIVLESKSRRVVAGTVGEISTVQEVSREVADELRREAEESGC